MLQIGHEFHSRITVVGYKYKLFLVNFHTLITMLPCT